MTLSKARMEGIPMSRKIAKTCAVCFLSLGLAACNSGGSSSADPEVTTDSSGDELDDVESGPGTGSGSGTDSDDNNSLVSASTVEIQRAAARSVSSGMSSNLASLQRLSDEAMVELEPDSLGAQLVEGVDLDMLSELDSDNSDFMNNTLGLDDSNAIIMREGDLITVDPDESRVCGSEFAILQVFGYSLANCEQIMADLTVQIQAETDDSGVINYLMQSDNLLSVAYAPDSVSYELQLAALSALNQRSEQLSGISESDWQNVSGSVRLSASVFNDDPGAVSGELMLEVIDAINVESTDEASESISLQPSTVFKITVDEISGDVMTTVDWGALQLIGDLSEDEDGSMLSQLNLAGLSGTASLNSNSPSISFANVGFNDVPLTLSINQVDSLRLTLSSFDVTLDAEQGLITFDGPLGAALTVNNLLGAIEGLGPEAEASLTINAAAGTGLRDLQDGSTQVINNGPFAVSAAVVSNGVSLQQSVSFAEGECFASDSEADAGLGIDLIAVPCAP